MSVIYRIGATAAITLGVFVPLWAILNGFSKRRELRPAVVPPRAERVLILGASSGIGRTLAHRYAERGARVCAVARRGAELEVVRSECEALATPVSSSESEPVVIICADASRAEDLITIREIIGEKWHGLDTLIVAAGVSALRPVLEIAGVEGPSLTQPSLDGIRRVEDVAMAAIKGNYLGPLLSVVTMIPFMRGTSISPSVLLISASYILYQSLSIEHPSVNFSYVLPATVEGDFRASAVDGGPVQEGDPNQSGLKREIKIVFIPAYFRFAQLLSWIWPSYIERKAAQKYRFTPT
ncbi:NAD(P)-binding protein [Russula aff. rugulosa BPL654]|nr:NAD(P)-binding protein [Russula aff. rugulosa BPL654]